MKLVFHSLVLIFSFGLVFVWQQTSLIQYNLQLLALLICFYLTFYWLRKKPRFKKRLPREWLDIFILNTVILLLLFLSGALYSPIFSLIYFLGFGISIVFEPATVILFVILTILIFLPQVLKNNSLESYIRLGSILLVTPLAFFFGQDFNKRHAQEAHLQQIKQQTVSLSSDIKQKVEDVLVNNDNLDAQDVAKLSKAIKETEKLQKQSNNK